MKITENIFKAGVAIPVILLFFGVLLWAKTCDPVVRQWVTLPSGQQMVVVRPKPESRQPLIIYLHGGGDLVADGSDIRLLTGAGSAVLGMDRISRNPEEFRRSMQALLQYLSLQNWVDTNAIAWVTDQLPWNVVLDFARQYPGQPPRAIVQLGVEPYSVTNYPWVRGRSDFPVVFLEGDNDTILPPSSLSQLSAALQTNGWRANTFTVPGAGHDLEPERHLALRCTGEYCMSEFGNPAAESDWREFRRPKAGTCPLWFFCLPAFAWCVGRFVWQRFRRGTFRPGQKLQYRNRMLDWLAILLGTLALVVVAFQLALPRLSAGGAERRLAAFFLLTPAERVDMEKLAAQSGWETRPLSTLIGQVKVAGYNRRLVNWNWDDATYLNFVLSPVITAQPGETFARRSTLWEEFYPRIRHESSVETAVKIVVRHLRERITIGNASPPSRDVSEIWECQGTDAAGFDLILVATLRSVGIPARLDSQGHADYWDVDKWVAAPSPSIISLPQGRLKLEHAE